MTLGIRRHLRLAMLVAAAVGVHPFSAAAKVFFYALTTDGVLARYDPDADQVEFKLGAGQGYINPRNEDSASEQQTRILDVARQRIVSGAGRPEGFALLDMQAETAKEITLGSPGTVLRIRQFIYPRRASRFYVHWLRKSPGSARPEVVMTAVGLDGQILGTSPSPLDEGSWPVYHPDGRSLYTFEGGRRVTLIDGETLTVRATYDLTPLARPGFRGPGLNDVRGGRALLAETSGAPHDPLSPATVFTTDLTFSAQSTSPRIATGLPALTMLLVPGGQTVLLQEPLGRHSSTGVGRLHFYDLVGGTKLGSVEFPAPEGADLLGFHPDGRRLFIQVFDRDPSTHEGLTRLVIVDAISRTVVRDRRFEDIGFATDFVDEPQ